MKVRTFLIVATVIVMVLIGASVGGSVGGKTLRNGQTTAGTGNGVYVVLV